jgi:hypothetical protein
MADEIRDTRNAHTLFWSFPKRGEDDLLSKSVTDRARLTSLNRAVRL